MSAAPVLPVDGPGPADPLLATHSPARATTDDDSVYTDELDAKLKTRMQQARAYVWMHSRCGRWATFYSTLVTVVQCVASYAAGCFGAAGSGTAALTYTGTAFSFLVGGISTLAKLKFSNFDAAAELHNGAVTAWNALWARVETQLDLPPHHRVPALEFVQMVDATFAQTESTSEAQLPLWVRRQCAAAWKRAAPADALPDMCRDATVQ